MNHQKVSVILNFACCPLHMPPYLFTFFIHPSPPSLSPSLPPSLTVENLTYQCALQNELLKRNVTEIPVSSLLYRIP